MEGLGVEGFGYRSVDAVDDPRLACILRAAKLEGPGSTT